MIWVWLMDFVMLVGRLFASPKYYKRPMNQNELCPACGNHNGKLSFMRVQLPVDGNAAVVRHDCKVCGCSWFVEPLYRHKLPAA